MPDNLRYLVTSAAGKTGCQTTLQLLANGCRVRALVRVDDDRAARLRDAGAEIFVGDQYALSDMRRAMHDVQRAYHCAPTAPNGLHFGTVFAVAAHEARVEHVVVLSQWLAASDHPSVFTREVWLNDAVLAMMPDITVTHVNVGWFADNYFMVLEPAAQLGILPMPLGRGSVKKNAPPSNEDIGAVAAGALMDPASHAGKTYRPTGPELMSPDEIATAMGKALRRKVKYLDVSEAMFLKALKALQPPGFSEAALTQLRLYVTEYQRGAFAVGGPTDAVERVAGRKPESFETIAQRVVAKRPEAVRSLTNRAAAIGNFMKILTTQKPDPDDIERRLGHVLLSAPVLCQDSAEWRDGHVPGAVSSDTGVKVLRQATA